MTAPAPDRRCGTCVLWDGDKKFPVWGACHWSRLNWPAVLRDDRIAHENDGTDCSQWSDGADAGEGGDE